VDSLVDTGKQAEFHLKSDKREEENTTHIDIRARGIREL
jgi:hypothetical protein